MGSYDDLGPGLQSLRWTRTSNVYLNSRQHISSSRLQLTNTDRHVPRPRSANTSTRRSVADKNRRNPRNPSIRSSRITFSTSKWSTSSISLPLRYQSGVHCPAIVKALLEGAGIQKSSRKSGPFDLLWVNGPIPTRRFSQLSRHHIINRLPKTIAISRKDLLCQSIHRQQKLYGTRSYDFLPETYIMPQHKEALFRAFVDGGDENSLWIVKPYDSRQGRGVFVTNRWRQIPTHSQVVVSRYISNPLLLDGRKCDLRVFACITSMSPLRVYVYDEGVVRIATEPYTSAISTLTNRFIHLTNSSINCQSPNYFVTDDVSWSNVGNKWTFDSFRRHLSESRCDEEPDPNDQLWPAINDIIVKTIISMESTVTSALADHVPSRLNCFELFGFDIMVDDQYRPWLLEVNQSPSLRCDTGLDLHIKSHLIADMFNMLNLHSHPSSSYGTRPSIQKRSNSHQDVSPSVMDESHRKGTSHISRPLSAQSGRDPLSLSCQPARPSSAPRGSSTRSTTLSSVDIPLDSGSSCPTLEGANLHPNHIRAIVEETNGEYDRRGRFHRLFPTGNWMAYAPLFGDDWSALNERLCRQCQGGERPHDEIRPVTLSTITKDNAKQESLAIFEERRQQRLDMVMRRRFGLQFQHRK